jgi:hypothetical protein
MHFGYFVKGKSMLYGGHGVKREETLDLLASDQNYPYL